MEGPASDERDGWLKYQAFLQGQLQMCENALKSIMQRDAAELLAGKLEENKKRIREEEKERVNKRMKLEEEERIRKEKEEKKKREQQEEERKLKEIEKRKKEELAERNRMLSKRGSTCSWSLINSSRFPTSMKDVKCVAITRGGYVAAMDSGGVYCDVNGCDGVNELKWLNWFQKSIKIDFIALGPHGQYVVEEEGNQDRIFRGCQKFKQLMRSPKIKRKRIRVAAFAAWDTYFVFFDDGCAYWGGDIPYDAEEFIKNGSSLITYAWFSEDGFSYAMKRENGKYSHRLPYWMDQYKEKFKNRSIKQLLIDDTTQCYFVRYT